MAEKDIAATPMMRQFYELKAKHPDAVLLFRLATSMKHTVPMLL
jgi:DNA mismatch repair ATPase MutS